MKANSDSSAGDTTRSDKGHLEQSTPAAQSQQTNQFNAMYFTPDNSSPFMVS